MADLGSNTESGDTPAMDTIPGITRHVRRAIPEPGDAGPATPVFGNPLVHPGMWIPLLGVLLSSLILALPVLIVTGFVAAVALT